MAAARRQDRARGPLPVGARRCRRRARPREVARPRRALRDLRRRPPVRRRARRRARGRGARGAAARGARVGAGVTAASNSSLGTAATRRASFRWSSERPASRPASFRVWTLRGLLPQCFGWRPSPARSPAAARLGRALGFGGGLKDRGCLAPRISGARALIAIVEQCLHVSLVELHLMLHREIRSDIGEVVVHPIAL